MAGDLIHDSRVGLRPGGRPVGRAAAQRARPVRGAARPTCSRSAGSTPAPPCSTSSRPTSAPPWRGSSSPRPPSPSARASRSSSRRPTSPCVAEIDTRRVERILRNLLVNAIEHGEGTSDRGAVVAKDEHAVAVTVRDHGIGLRPGEASLVFNRFWRADPARARTTGGTGLGSGHRARGRPAAQRLARRPGAPRARGPASGSPCRARPARRSSRRPLPLNPLIGDVLTSRSAALRNARGHVRRRAGDRHPPPHTRRGGPLHGATTRPRPATDRLAAGVRGTP